ncbi:peptide deformylase [Granulibacter bethesdensis]|nr:peptide deformylase [Granulibacter bethesdensis]
MSILKIARMGHPVLLRRADPVPDPTAPEIQRLALDMIETMIDAPGVGLAAPQVYQSLRMFVFRVPVSRGGEEIPPTVLINPELALLGDEIQMCWEGCLSIPGFRGEVPRAMRVRYRGIGLDGAVIEREASGFHANVIQHEYDHLNGILYPMRMDDLGRLGFEEEIARAQAALAAEQAAERKDDAE